MAILEADIKLFKSVNQTDELSGGGRISNVEVVSNEVNNLFFPLARIDHVQGDVSLRKTDLKITSAGTEVYAENHFAMKTLPVDTNVNVIIVPDEDTDSTVSDILKFIHNNAIRKFYGATILSAAMTAGDGTLTVPDTKAVILPVINTEVIRNIPLDTTILGQGNRAVSGDSVATADYEYFIPDVTTPVRIIIRENYEWVEFNCTGDATTGTITSTIDANTSTYDVSAGVMNFDLPSGHIADADTKIIVIIDGISHVYTFQYYTHSYNPIKPSSFVLGPFTVYVRENYDNGSDIVPGYFYSDDTVNIIDDGDGNLVFDVATIDIDLTATVNYTGVETFNMPAIAGIIDYTTGFHQVVSIDSAPVKLDYNGSDRDEGDFNNTMAEFCSIGLTQFVPINSFKNWNNTSFGGDGRCPIFVPGDVIVIFDPVAGDEMLLVSAVDYDTHTITTLTNCQYNHATANTVVSSAFVGGNLQALVTNMFTQESWDMSTWGDDTVGNEAQGDFDSSNYPIVLTNIGSAAGRWAFKVVGLSPLTMDVYHEKMGVIANNIDATADIGDPMYATDNAARLTNPVTGEPYMTIEFEAWGDAGGNWQVGNVFFVKTVPAEQPGWFLRVVQSGVSAIVDDTATVHIRGDVE